MQRLKAFRIFFSLTALLFIAKPFLGFGAFNQQIKPRISHTILVKSFTKRKPETLQEADDKAEAIHLVLSNPLMVLISSITFLLASLLPLILERTLKLTGKMLSDIHTGLIPAGPAYLLAGKLTI
jgi:hypothetical protein